MARHQGNHFGYTDAIEDALNKIDLSQSDDAILKGVNKAQEIAKKNMQNGTPIRAKDMWNENIFGKDTQGVGNERVYNLWTGIFNKA